MASQTTAELNVVEMCYWCNSFKSTTGHQLQQSFSMGPWLLDIRTISEHTVVCFAAHRNTDLRENAINTLQLQILNSQP